MLGETPTASETWFTIGGLSLLENSQRAELRHAVRHVSRRGTNGCPKGLTLDAMLGQLARRAFGRFRKRSSCRFRRRRFAAWAFAAASRCRCKIAATWAATALGPGRGRDRRRRRAVSRGSRRSTRRFRPGVPQIFVDIDREKVKMLDMPLSDVFATLQAYLGSAYVNDFNKFGRVYQVRVQAEPKFRAEPDDIERLEVRNRDGPNDSAGHAGDGPQSRSVRRSINRYNLYPSASITGEPAPGLQHRRGARPDGADRRPHAAAAAWATNGPACRIRKSASAARRSGLRDGRDAGVPGARRPVRKLVHAAGRDPGRAAGPAGRDRGRVAAAAWTTTSTRRSASC